MAKIWETTKSYYNTRIYVNLITRLSFSKLTVEGEENIPKDSAVLLAPNHCCALMDPLLILQALEKPVGFGARSDIFRNPKIAKILRFLKILPIARERNGLKEVAGNYEAFDEIFECFDKNMPFCLFAEGTHNTNGSMLPMKKRSFMLCKEASEKLGKPIYIVPTALEYDYFFRQGARASVRFAKPIEINEYFAAHSDEFEAEVYKSLCTQVRDTDLSMLGKLPERQHNLLVVRIFLAALSLPLFLSCALASLLIWLPAELILSGFEDKAWTHTVYFALRFVFPLLLPFYWLFSFLLCKYKQLFEDFSI